jgi:hypothetical protein
MGKATTIVTQQVRDKLYARADVTIIKDEMWDVAHHWWNSRENLLEVVPETRFLKFLHPEAPDGRHVDVILDEEGLRFKPDADV